MRLYLIFCLLFAGFHIYSSGQAPIITSLTPASGPVGSTVVVTGNNFSISPPSNVVLFGSIKAQVIAGTANELSVIVPVGAASQFITVTTNNLTGYSNRPFNVTYPAGSELFHSNSFAAKVDSSTGTLPYSVFSIDLNGDGKPDLVSANNSSSTISVLKNTGSPGVVSFGAKTDFLTGTAPTNIAAGDFNGDGRPDLAVTNYNISATVSVLINTSTGSNISFAPKSDFTTGSFPLAIAVHDIDGDGLADIAVSNNASSSVSILRNTTSAGGLSFATKVDLASGPSPYGLIARDLDNDGKIDLAVTNHGLGTISTFKNNSSPGVISFGLKADLTTGNTPRGLAVGDLDGDGKAELACVNWGSGTLSIFKNTSAGSISFAAKFDSSIAAGTSLQHLIISDLTGDGRLDIAVANSTVNQIALFRNNSSAGTLQLAQRTIMATATNPYFLCPGDMDGDGKDDLIAASSGINKLSVFRNTPPPFISSYTPSIAAAGDVVTITGYNFRPDISANIVHFGAVKSTINSATQTSLTVTIPAGVTYQSINVITDNLSGASARQFVASFPGGATTLENSFAPRFDINNVVIPRETAVSDIDGDGKPDLVVANFFSTVSIYRNTGSAGNILFAPKTDLTAISSLLNISAGDVNGDGKPEIVTANGENNSFSLFRNTSSPGTISFASRIDIASYGSDAHTVVIADMNADGKPDLVVGTGAYVTIYSNTSTGTSLSFVQKPAMTSMSILKSLAVADVNEDGKLDIIAGNSVYKNTGADGNFAFTEQTYNLLGAPNMIATGDLTGDGKPEIVTVTSNTNTLRVFINASGADSISFAASTAFLTGAFPMDVALADLNGDGKTDIAVAGHEYDGLSVYMNDGNASSFSILPKVDYNTALEPFSVTIGDWDGDGRGDLTTANRLPNSISILRFNVYPAQPNVPTIDSLHPSAAPVGSLVDIRGTNFTPNVNGNIVYFGAVKAEVVSASANMLTVKVPPGANFDPITVTNANKFSAVSNKQFIVTFPASGSVNANSFEPYLLFPTGLRAKAIITGDIDGDGKADMAVANNEGNNVSIYRNTGYKGTISFTSKSDISVGTNPTDVLLADLDGDWKKELIATNSANNTISVFRNNSSVGNISFGNQQTFSTDIQSFGFPVAVAVGDLDGDGRLDLAVANKNAQTISLFRNITNGNIISFAAQVYFESPYEPQSIIVKDLDGNGKPDIAVSNYSGLIDVFNNTSSPGSISFVPPVRYIGGHSNSNVVFADFNNDGRAELAAAGISNTSFCLLKNQSIRNTFYFDAKTDYGNTSLATAITAGDINGDGRNDLVNLDYFGGAVSVSVYRTGYDSITFKPLVTFPVGTSSTSPVDVHISDVDGDGKADILVANTLSNTIAILRNKIGDPYKFCSGGSDSLVSNLTGINYQWQVSTDSGANFLNIFPSANYSGVYGKTLGLNNIPSSWSGYQYICLVDGMASDKYVIRFSNSWIGGAGNAWENTANWSCGVVPDDFTDVVIGAGSNVVLSSNATVASLTLVPGAQFTVANGFTLVVTGR